MKNEYSIVVINQLRDKFYSTKLLRPLKVSHYEVNDILHYECKDLNTFTIFKVKLQIEKFIGGGFAGQVYRVRLLELSGNSSLKIGNPYAMKILIPPSSFSKFFRDSLYFLGFQGSFPLQVNPHAHLSGALWQKFIRRAAKNKFGNEDTVVDIHATFIDPTLGSTGEISEWIEGRIWRLEVNDQLNLLSKWEKGIDIRKELLGSPEYRNKKTFMKDFVSLLHEIGAHEFARQYEWSTWKSQPNCLKRKSYEANPDKGLVAVDFRAGLALLPFLPMSPGDFKLILTGILRGSLVQFDRGDLKKLEAYLYKNKSLFIDLIPTFEELKNAENIYRNSLIDFTHNHIKLFTSKKLWATIFENLVTSFKTQNLIEPAIEKTLRKSRILTSIFSFFGFLPIIGKPIQKFWGRQEFRRHYLKILTSLSYLKTTLKARAFEFSIHSLATGRLDEIHAIDISRHTWKMLYHFPLSFFPIFIHRMFTDIKYLKTFFSNIFIEPIRLYFNAQLREKWFIDMVEEGKKKQILNDEESSTIISQIKEPYIQKYLKCLVVHICLMPVTHVVAFACAIYFVFTHPEMPRAQAWAIGAGIVAFFQIIPISPGSLARGFYVLYLIIREKNFRDYNLAIFISFFKYIGYLAFPFQMAYRYPTLARFMAGHWATEAVHLIPVFGERGALLESKVFNLFYNWPLTLRRRVNLRSNLRLKEKKTYLHIPILVILGTIIFAMCDYFNYFSWYFAILIPVLCGIIEALLKNGLPLKLRILFSGLIASLIGLSYPIITPLFSELSFKNLIAGTLWRIFLFTLIAIITNIITELILPEPEPESN